MTHHPDTLCVQEGWQPKNGEPRVLPIYQSTTYKYDSSEHVGDLFDLKVPGHFYTRLSNPTAEAVEKKLEVTKPKTGEELDKLLQRVYATPRPIVEKVLELQKKDR